MSLVLVTGATGFVGRRLIRLLADKFGPEQIVCLAYDQADNDLERSGRRILDELGIRYIPVDLVSGRGLDKAPKSPDYVFHFAANTDTADPDHRVNDIGTANLLNAIGPLGSNCHFLFTGTIAVSDHRADPVAPVNEETPLLRPYHIYGRRKLLTEQILRDAAAKQGFALTIIRLSCIFGRGTRKDGLFDQLVKMARTKPFISRLNYPGLMSYTHVDDIAGSFVRLADHPPATGTFQLFIPVSEALPLCTVIEQVHEELGETYHPIRLPSIFWKFCDWGARFAFLFESLVPHKVHNKIWQMSLTVNNAYYNQTRKINDKFPAVRFKTFREAVRDMAGLENK